MFADLRVIRQLPHPLGLLIATQFIFNVGFYLVVPFLAAYLEEDLGLAVALIGLILGLRTFSQQGLFFLGGALADWFGIKPVLLVGIAVRVIGFATLAITQELTWIIVGTMCIGMAAALFSPASESAILGLAGQAESAKGIRRTRVLSLQQVFSQAGSAVGPALGGVVLFVPFQTTCLIAAVLFAIVGVVHLFWLPSRMRVGDRTRVSASLRLVLGNRRFMIFAALNIVQLIAYNQMYLALPVELARSGDNSSDITFYFLLASVLVILLQSRITAWTDSFPTTKVFLLSHLFMSAAFVAVGAIAWFPSAGGAIGALPKIGMVVLIHLGLMVLQPRARDMVGKLAGENQLGSHMGVMNSLGGCAVLFSGVPVGSLLEAARVPGPSAVVPWIVLAALPMAVAAIATPVLRWLGSE